MSSFDSDEFRSPLEAERKYPFFFFINFEISLKHSYLFNKLNT